MVFINKLLTIIFEINVYIFKMPSEALKIKKILKKRTKLKYIIFFFS